MNDPARVDPAIQHESIAANGLRFHVATCGEGDRLALCLHGFPESWYSWRHQLPLLARLGYRAWAPDLRGYGETERPPRLQDYALEALMEDVAGLIEASGAREVTLLAHDWGAIIAWAFAMHGRVPLDRLAIFNVPHPAAFREQMTFAQLRRSWYMLFFQLPRIPEWVLGRDRCAFVGEAFRRTCAHPEQFPDAVRETYRASAAQPGALTAMLNYYRALIRGGGGGRLAARGVTPIAVPTLFVWGVQDVALTLATTFGTERHVPDLTLRYLPDASHWVQQDEPTA